MAKGANVIRPHLVDYRRYLARVSARDCHFQVPWFAQILAGCTNIFLRSSAELFELPPAVVASSRSNREISVTLIVAADSSRRSCEVGPGWGQALPARSAVTPSPQWSSFPASRKHRTGSLVPGDPPLAIRVGELCAVYSHPAATFPEPSTASSVADASILFSPSSRPGRLRGLRGPLQFRHPRFDILYLDCLGRVVQNAIRSPHSRGCRRIGVDHNLP
jgi:hypothetical protein